MNCRWHLRTQSRLLAVQWRRCKCDGTGFVAEMAFTASREWPRTEAEFYLLRSAMFDAQVIARDMEKSGREAEIETISRNIPEVAPELSGEPANDPLNRPDVGGRSDRNPLGCAGV